MSDINIRVGQQNAIKVVSSISGSAGGRSVVAKNVVGGIASVTQLNVSGISTFVGVATFKSDVYIDGDLYISDDLTFDEFSVRNGRVSGILTANQAVFNEIVFPAAEPYGVAYFNSSDQIVSTASTSFQLTETNLILSTNSFGIPTWSNTIDGGVY